MWLKSYLVLLGLFALAFYTVNLVESEKQKNRPQVQNENKMDAFVVNITATHFDREGNPHSQLSSPKITHYPTHDTALLEKPHIIVYQAKELPYHITAENGVSRHGSEIFDLSDNVILHQASSEKNLGITLTTQALTVYPKIDYAKTEHPVTIFNDKHRITATGMETYMKQKRIKLLSNVEGTHHVGDMLS